MDAGRERTLPQHQSLMGLAVTRIATMPPRRQRSRRFPSFQDAEALCRARSAAATLPPSARLVASRIFIADAPESSFRNAPNAARSSTPWTRPLALIHCPNCGAAARGGGCSTPLNPELLGAGGMERRLSRIDTAEPPGRAQGPARARRTIRSTHSRKRPKPRRRSITARRQSVPPARRTASSTSPWARGQTSLDDLMVLKAGRRDAGARSRSRSRRPDAALLRGLTIAT